MNIVYSDRYHIDIGTHVFQTTKYALVRTALIERGFAAPADFVEPQPARWEDLALAHADDYLRKARTGGFTPAELAQLEMPWSETMVEGFRLMTGGTIVAARLAVGARRGGAAFTAHLGGGFHHAFPAHGEGFCLFNDVAVAIRVLQREGAIARAAVVDCDVHHGNGTATVFGSDPSVFTFSIHQQANYPAFKPPSTLDVGLPDGTGDHVYARALEQALPKVLGSRPDLLFFLAGADPFIQDQLGGLNLTFDGLRLRDHLVLHAAVGAGIPVVIVLAGGYARRVEDVVAIHVATLEQAAGLEADGADR